MVWQVFGVSINNDINRHGISHAKTLINNQEGYTLICLNYVPLNFFFSPDVFTKRSRSNTGSSSEGKSSLLLFGQNSSYK